MTTLDHFNNDQRRYRQYVDREDAIGEDRLTVLNTLLVDARGYDNRVSAKNLAEHTTVSASTVRDIVTELRVEFGLPVASLGILNTPTNSTACCRVTARRSPPSANGCKRLRRRLTGRGRGANDSKRPAPRLGTSHGRPYRRVV